MTYGSAERPSGPAVRARLAPCRSIGEELSDRTGFERFPYPRRLVVGLFKSEQDLQHAVEALERVRFDSDSYEVLRGEEDARSLDLEGGAHGVSGRVLRAVQAASSFDREHTRRHVQHLQGGGQVLAVLVGDDENAKRRAGDAMREHGGDFINYYADTYVESL
jgi:hypothetical protein